MRFKNSISFIVVLIIAHVCAFAHIYFCPKTPIMVKIGTLTPGSWIIKKHESRLGALDKFYQRYFGRKYHITTWVMTSYGDAGEFTPEVVYTLECCSPIKVEGKFLCAEKIISEHDCITAEDNTEKFICRK